MSSRVLIESGAAREHNYVRAWAMGVVIAVIMAVTQEDPSIVHNDTTCKATLSIGERSMVLENIGLPTSEQQPPTYDAAGPPAYDAAGPPAYDGDK